MTLADKLAAFKTFTTQAWALTRPYFASDQKWKARALLVAIVALNLSLVYMAVLFNDWYKVFYDALQEKNASVFWAQMTRFAWLAFAFIILAVYKFYLTQLLVVRWRAWMTNHYLTRWLSNQAFYKMELLRFAAAPNTTGHNPDNPDQRIQDDINQFTNDSIALSMGLLNAVVTLASFVGILWGLSGNFAFTLGGQTFDIPGFMVWMALLYCLVGSVITHYLGRPQIQLNFEQQRREADFRHHMVRVREYSEAIALDRGEAVERSQLERRFGLVLGNYLNLIRAQKRLVWFTSFFGQAAVVFPFVVAAPRFFSGAIQLGELVQISSAFGQVQNALSWFVDNYSSLAAWRATTNRLTSFEASFQALALSDQGLVATDSEVLSSTDLHLTLPNGSVLLDQAQLQAQPGDSILLNGPSGAGKSTLFRALAGIWPFASGHLSRPPDSMFLPQRPYFPNGPLREALAYPQEASLFSDDELTSALHRALLPELSTRLDEVGAWSQTLSGGEQQRLAVARVLLKKPRWIFADEATSALDEASESLIYKTLLAQIQQGHGAIVSIAHKPAVAAFHTSRWVLEKVPEAEVASHRLRVEAAPA
ncbi:ABC transporter ATP-binding protein/permease [Rhodoferax fermentans]|uniref:ABC transporter ATP-binding protein n=1 Tax=Rhodoferax fermentans TaxID=28066 RepID=A0A1T1ATM9_RHOFE|nr:ABC transporter ATP-binding protein/permease [Rhodoferax fermentans]MBK1683031.1 ABC transporter ATP-binding protein [Rhodoferax fermentans]OOV07464.1 ABC transporter ATP-binding protein [Rhodoferax fermentans]